MKHENLEKTIEVILKEFKKVTKNKIPDKEIKKAKEYIKGKTMMALESSSAVASFLGDQELFRREIKEPQEIFDKIDQVTAEEIHQVAEEIFVKEQLNLAIIGPHGKNFSLDNLLKF